LGWWRHGCDIFPEDGLFRFFFLYDFNVNQVRSYVYIWFVVNRFRERGGSLRETAEDDKELGGESSEG
jgi:hypothetical protein